MGDYFSGKTDFFDLASLKPLRRGFTFLEYVFALRFFLKKSLKRLRGARGVSDYGAFAACMRDSVPQSKKRLEYVPKQYGTF